MPEIKKVAGGYIVTDASGRVTLAKTKTLENAKIAQAQLERQRRLILTGSTETFLPKDIGTPERARAFLKSKKKNGISTNGMLKGMSMKDLLK